VVTQQGQLGGAPYQWRKGTCGPGLGRGTVGCAASSALQGRDGALIDPQRLGQQADRRPLRQVDAALQVADAAGRKTGPFGQFLLGQAGGDAPVSEERSEAIGSGDGHVLTLSRSLGNMSSHEP
jgi:hypothetical protein